MRFDAWELPEGEAHLQDWMRRKNQRCEGRLTYQKHKYDKAIEFCHQRRTAVDVGAHVGLWSYWMAVDFGKLYAFEPIPEHVACWRINMEGRGDATLHEVALGDRAGVVSLETGPSSSGDTRVVDGDGSIPMDTLDAFALEDVDFLKIDCEGFESFVVDGGRETLLRCRPVVVIEQKPGFGKRYGRSDLAGVRLLEHMGARRVWDYAGDYVLQFPKVA